MERFDPEQKTTYPQLYYEHVHRYLLAKENISGGTVVDLACGAGYGSVILAKVAQQVIGIDVAPDAILAAEQRRDASNVRFLRADCSKTGLPSGSADCVVSFETIEHLEDPEAFIQEIARILKPTGVLFLSSPDKREYTDTRAAPPNPYHKRELYHEELKTLLEGVFAHTLLARQRIVAGSLIAVDAESRHHRWESGVFSGSEQNSDFRPGVPHGLYSFAICSRNPLPQVKLGIFENKNESGSVWEAYENRFSLREGRRQAEIRAAEARTTLEDQERFHSRLHAELKARLTHLEDLKSPAQLRAALTGLRRLIQDDLTGALPPVAQLETLRAGTTARIELKLHALTEQLQQRHPSASDAIAGLAATLTDIEALNVEAQRLLRERDAEREETVAANRDEIGRLEAEVSRLHRTLEEERQSAAQARSETESYRRGYNHLKNTFSWKATVPFRAARRLFERLSSRVKR